MLASAKAVNARVAFFCSPRYRTLANLSSFCYRNFSMESMALALCTDALSKITTNGLPTCSINSPKKATNNVALI